MRKIERLMNAAIAQGKRHWQNANTTVQTDDNGVARVFLHGNQIAEIGEGFIQLWDGGWQTNTTKSRLNAILAENGLPGESVFQKNFEWFVNMNGTTIPFFSGMRLN
jgi:hypothetical protein